MLTARFARGRRDRGDHGGIGTVASGLWHRRPADELTGIIGQRPMPHVRMAAHFESWHRLPTDVSLDHWQDANLATARRWRNSTGMLTARFARGRRDRGGIWNGWHLSCGIGFQPMWVLKTLARCQCHVSRCGFRSLAGGQWHPQHLQKVIALFFADRRTQSLQDVEYVFPYLPFLGERLIPEQIGGMIRDHQWGVVERMPAAS
jgi:hypothetical protein